MESGVEGARCVMKSEPEAYEYRSAAHRVLVVCIWARLPCSARVRTHRLRARLAIEMKLSALRKKRRLSTL